MRFASLEYTTLLLALPVFALFFWIARRRFLNRLNRLADSEMAGWISRRVSDRKAIVKTVLVFAAMGFMIFALTRPQMGGQSTLVKREGIDLLFVLDVSKSMEVKDIRPSRLKRAKLELQSLMEQLSGDRVGIISFAGAAFVQSPLTSDYSAAKMFLKALSPNDMPVKGTSVGDALKLAHKLFTETTETAGSRLVVLLTDGEDHGENLDEAINLLKDEKIPVFAVGIGSASGEPIPQFDDQGNMSGYLKDRNGKTVMSRLNEKALREIAQKTSGKYVNLQAGGSLDDLKDYVGTMQKQQFESSLYTQYEEKFYYLLWPAFVLLLLASLIDDRRNSRLLGVAK